MKKIILKLRCYLMGLLVQPIVRLFSLFFSLKKNKFMCISMNGNNYGDNIKCLADYIVKKKQDVEIVWAFNYSSLPNLNCPYRHVKLFSFSYYYHILTSKYILCNFAMDFSYLAQKRQGQVFLETWHGTALKRIGYEMYKSERPDVLYRWFGVDRIKHTVELADIWLSGSRFMTNVFNNSFARYDGLYEIGTPRNDLFFKNNPDIIEKVKNQYGIKAEEGVILYAPTFRRDRKFTYYDVDLSKIKTIWEKKTGKTYKLLVRLHPVMLTKEKEFSGFLSNDAINASLYPDMQELLFCTDLLITDYSSSMFDYMYMKRPVIMYVPDKKSYSRGFYIDIEKLPFILVNNNKELERQLSEFDKSEYLKRLDIFISSIGSVESGNATEKTYRLLIGN